MTSKILWMICGGIWLLLILGFIGLLVFLRIRKGRDN